jgi:hypothetical protein
VWVAWATQAWGSAIHSNSMESSPLLRYGGATVQVVSTHEEINSPQRRKESKAG